MVLVGDPARFAIEYEPEPAPSDAAAAAQWTSGRIRWWCGGRAVGRYEPSTMVRYVAAATAWVLRQDDARRDSDLIDRPAEEVARIVTDALFADIDRSDEQIAADGARYGPFFVRPRLAVFDPWDIFVVEGAAYARLIWGPAGHRELHELRLRPGEFAEVLRGFLDALQWEDVR